MPLHGYTISEKLFADPLDKAYVLYTGRFLTIDINHDGITDLFGTLQFLDQHGPASYVAFFGDGTGGFKKAPKSTLKNITEGSVSAREIISSDFNGDKLPDIFIADHGTDWGDFSGYPNQLLLGTSKGGFVAAPDHIPDISDFTHSTAIGDVDGDGDVDIYVGNLQWEKPPYLLINDGAGRFTRSTVDLPAELRPTSLDTHSSYTTSLFIDVDGDKDLDLFLGGDEGADTHFLAINDGHGNFTKATETIPAGSYGSLKTIALDAQPFDFNKDGIDDILVASTRTEPFYTNTKLQVLISTGDGGLTDQTTTYLDAQPAIPGGYVNFINFVDVNNDGALDFLAEVHGPEKHLIYVNDGENHFYKLPTKLVPFDVWGGAVGIADVNKDGWNDFVTWNLFGDIPEGQQNHLRVAEKMPIPSGLVEGSGQADAFLAGPGKQTILGKGGKDFLAGGNGKDTLRGGDNADTLLGGDGKDRLEGGRGNDLLAGGPGNDKIKGNAGKDHLVGGSGKDTLTGGKGADKFVFKSEKDSPSKKKADLIADFSQNQNDRIKLKAIDAEAGTPKNDEFTFIGDDAFSGTEGELRFEQKRKKTFVYGDTDGDGKADFAIKLKGAVDLDAGDFIL